MPESTNLIMNIKGSFSLILAILAASVTFAQVPKRLYFIEKVNIKELMKNAFPDIDKPQIASVAVELYSYKNGIKQDSLTLHADNLYTWKDSVAFRVNVPESYFADQKISLQPIYHLKKNGKKGNLPSYVVGNEQMVNPLLLKIKSNPSGAKVYLVPKLYWDRNPDFAKFKTDALFLYQVSEGVTTVTTYVQEYVYIAVFKYQDRFLTMPCTPNHLHKSDSLFVDFQH